MIVKWKWGLFKKVPPLLCPAEPPFFVVPSGSEASLASFGTASRDVIPRHASAEGPLACARGDKKGLGVTKNGSG
jgi:hypothetical protein